MLVVYNPIWWDVITLNSFIQHLKHNLTVMQSVAFVTYKEWAAYRTHSMVSILVGPIYFMVQYFIWKAVYTNTSSIQGMDFDRMIIYFGANALIGYLTMDFADWNLQMLVRTGKFLTFTLRPIHHTFFALSQKVGHRFLGFLFEFLPCYLIFLFLFRVNMIPKHIGFTILSIIIAFFMNFFVNYMIGLTCFWFTMSSGIRGLYGLFSSIFSGALIPLIFFPEKLQWILFFLPFQYLLYVPAMVFTGDYHLAGFSIPIPTIVGIQAIAMCVTMLLCLYLYRISIKRFSAVGA